MRYYARRACFRASSTVLQRTWCVCSVPISQRLRVADYFDGLAKADAVLHPEDDAGEGTLPCRLGTVSLCGTTLHTEKALDESLMEEVLDTLLQLHGSCSLRICPKAHGQQIDTGHTALTVAAMHVTSSAGGQEEANTLVFLHKLLLLNCEPGTTPVQRKTRTSNPSQCKIRIAR